MKKIISIAIVIAMIATIALACFTQGAATDPNPADSYVKQIAANEDSALDMWFEHSTVKVYQDDHESTGMDTYSIYMAKNEIQGAHVILYASDETKQDLTVSYDQFVAMDGSGATIETAFFYEFYIQTSNVATDDIIEFTAENSIIRNGTVPEAIAPVESLNRASGKFSIPAGKTQALYLRLKTTADTPSGWYSGSFDIKNSAGEVIKTATAFAYVWNFALPEENHYQSGVYVSYVGSAPQIYENEYNYLLENRLQAFDLPGNLNSSNPYLDDPRVTAFRIAKKGTYLGTMTNDEIKATYDDLKTRADWAELEPKTYFYTVDEPTSQQWIDYVRQYIKPNYYRPTLEECASENRRINSVWPNANTLVVFCEDYPYPNTYNPELLKNSDGTYQTVYDGSARFNGVSDGIQAAMDQNVAKIWCPKMLMFTPHEAIVKAGYVGHYGDRYFGVRSMNGVTSGFKVSSIASNYFDWDTLYGSFPERFFNYQSEKALRGEEVKLWWYACGKNGDYSYCYHNIENTGLQSELMSWQAMQEHSLGYLYYGSNSYADEEGLHPLTMTSYVPGTKSDGLLYDEVWQCNPCARDNHVLYGNGVLFYEKGVIGALKLRYVNVLGTIRVEQIRDGIEDYEMLWLYREKFGEEAVQRFIKKVSNNVVSYLTMPSFDRSMWPDSMRNEDVFAEIRIELGNILEEAYGAPAECTHVWDSGEITVEPTYKQAGEKTYTCTLCGETYTEEIPALPTVYGDVDGNGSIDAKDLKALLQYIVGILDENDIVYANADIDGNREIGATDVKELRKIFVTM